MSTKYFYVFSLLILTAIKHTQVWLLLVYSLHTTILLCIFADYVIHHMRKGKKINIFYRCEKTFFSFRFFGCFIYLFGNAKIYLSLTLHLNLLELLLSFCWLRLYKNNLFYEQLIFKLNSLRLFIFMICAYQLFYLHKRNCIG